MRARGVAAPAVAALLIGLLTTACDDKASHQAAVAGPLMVKDGAADTWHELRSGYEPSDVTANVDLTSAVVSFTREELSFELDYAGPLDPSTGDFGAQVRVAFSADTDSELVVEWWSDRPRAGEASESTTGPDPFCHPTATPAYADGRVTVHVPVGRGCLSRHHLPERLQVRLVTSWADGNIHDSMFTDQQYAKGDVWVALADGD